MYCRHCGAELDDGAFFCKECGRRVEDDKQTIQHNNNVKEKKKLGCGTQIAIFIIIILIAFFVIIVAGGILSNDNNTKTSDSAIEKTEENVNVGNNTDGIELTIGDTTIVDDFECQIKEVNWYSSSDFDYDIIDREDGYEYIVIVLSEKNTTDSTENAPMFSILSADGQQCTNKAGLSLYKNQYKINFGATMAGATAEAYVIYQIPSGAETFKLQIMSNGFGANSEYIFFERDDIQ